MPPRQVSKRVPEISDTEKEALITSKSRKRARSISPGTKDMEFKTQIFYFSPSSSVLSTLESHFHLDYMTTNLLSALIHQFQLAIYLVSTPEVQDASPINHEHPAGIYAKKNITKALSSHVNSDKLFPLRRTGESMKYILQELKSLNSRLDVFQALVWRVSAFGEMDKLRSLNFAGGSRKNSRSSLVISARALEFDIQNVDFKDAFLDEISTIFNSEGFLKQQHTRFPRPVYGQLQLSRKEFGGMLEGLWNISQKIFDGYQGEHLQSFEDVRNLFKKEKESSCHVDMVPSHGLLAWLIACDMWESGLCEEPTCEDLAKHMGGKTLGPVKAVLKVARIAGAVASSNAQDLKIMLEKIMEVFDYFSDDLKLEEKSELRVMAELARDCKVLQGRKLSIVDVEHALCKISREILRGDTKRGRDSNGTTESSTEFGGSKKRKLEEVVGEDEGMDG